jgi:hypothetical protein
VNGHVTDWNDAVGSGMIDADPPDIGTYPVDREDCKPSAQAALRHKAIPPDAPVPVTFDVDLRGHAINVEAV